MSARPDQRGASGAEGGLVLVRCCEECYRAAYEADDLLRDPVTVDGLMGEMARSLQAGPCAGVNPDGSTCDRLASRRDPFSGGWVCVGHASASTSLLLRAMRETLEMAREIRCGGGDGLASIEGIEAAAEDALFMATGVRA